MAQQRFINFGDTVLAQRINEISTAIVNHGVLSGGTFSVGITNRTLRISPNKVMLNELLLIEDNFTDILVPIVGTGSQDFTVVYEHSNQNVQGGVPAIILITEGLFGFDDLDDSTILGWIRYPGGSVPLDTAMFIEAPKLQIKNPEEFPSSVQVPPFLTKIYVQTETPTPGAIVAVDQYDPFNLKAFMELENSAAAINTIQHLFPFISGVEAPNRIILEASVELGASVTASLLSEDGTVFTALDDTITNTSSIFEFREMQVPNVDVTKFAQNRPYFVSISTQLNPGKKAFISIVGTSSNFLPF